MEDKEVIQEEVNGVPFIKYPLFKENQTELLAVFSTKQGGVSEGVFQSMNLAFGRGDDDQKVFENFKLFSNAIGVDPNRMVFSSQHHHNRIRLVTQEDIGKGIDRERDYSDIDGLMTNIPRIPLVTFHADCAPIYFYDPEKKVIGLAHAGWKGTSLKIAGNMVDQMKEQFHTDPHNLLVAIGPCICGNCYEVGEDVKREFDQLDLDGSFFIRDHPEKEKYFLDIGKANQMILMAHGVLEKNIRLSNLCTMENLPMFFSHRGNQGKRGTQVAVMEIL
jgi:YfiH family protein